MHANIKRILITLIDIKRCQIRTKFISLKYSHKLDHFVIRVITDSLDLKFRGTNSIPTVIRREEIPLAAVAHQGSAEGYFVCFEVTVAE